MSPSIPDTAPRPRVGIPWRTLKEETENTYPKIAKYVDAVTKAGGEPILLSLQDPKGLQEKLSHLDAFVLPGSPADVDPKRYGRVNEGLSGPDDPARAETDFAIFRHAFAEKKPVLGICHGCQLLNIYLGGTLIQDLRSQTGTTMPHRRLDLVPEPPDDPRHPATFEPDSHLAAILGATQAEVNSSHHQAVETPGKGLRVTAHAPDGTIEAVEWIGDSNWVTGVQWHPERITDDGFAQRIFQSLIAAAKTHALQKA